MARSTKDVPGASVRITAKVEGFRRAGVAHSTAGTPHAAGTFTAAQIEALKAEPMLVVEDIDDPAPSGGKVSDEK